MKTQSIAMALACATIILPDQSAAVYDELPTVQPAPAAEAVPIPRSRIMRPQAVYQLAAYPAQQDEFAEMPAHLPKVRASLDNFRLVTPPIDIRVTAPPSATGGQGRRGTPRKPDLYAAGSYCLAKAIYYEARSEPRLGRLAVGRVILNRVKSRYYPNSICEVVYQNAHMRNRCQFSFACDGKADIPRNMRAWGDAVKLAELLRCRTGNTCRPPIVGGRINVSTHYHATYVKPRWAKTMPRTGRIGRHIFYYTASR